MNKEENKKSINTGSGGPVRQMHWSLESAQQDKEVHMPNKKGM